jgi:hypothetical protein
MINYAFGVKHLFRRLLNGIHFVLEKETSYRPERQEDSQQNCARNVNTDAVKIDGGSAANLKKTTH